MPTRHLKQLGVSILFAICVAQATMAQEKPKVFFSDDFLLDNTSAPTYTWFHGSQSGILEKTHAVERNIR